MKKLISILLVCVMVAGCSARQEHSNGSAANETSVSETESSRSAAESAETSPVQSSSVTSSATSKTSDVTSSASSTSAVSSSASSTASKDDTASKAETSTVSEDNTSAASSNVSSSSTSASAPVELKPAWSEETIDTVTVFVNTQGIYSRKNAIVGSERVKMYSLNDKVTVVAKTDTGYYKLDDGSFIHKDYLSDKETPKPVEPQKPSNPSQPSTAISADITTLLNNAPLNPILTNDEDVDVLITDILNEIITDDMTTAQKVKAIYDYIIQNYTYGRRVTYNGATTTYSYYENDQNFRSLRDAEIATMSYSLIKFKKGVCDHYASLFMTMTRRIGLESYRVNGQVQSSKGGTTGHSWVIMKLDGQYYTFDAQIEQSNRVNGQIMYKFFCKPESAMTGFYTYGATDDMRLTQKYYKYDPPIMADNPRDLAIACFKDFIIDEGECPYYVIG